MLQSQKKSYPYFLTLWLLSCWTLRVVTCNGGGCWIKWNNKKVSSPCLAVHGRVQFYQQETGSTCKKRQSCCHLSQKSNALFLLASSTWKLTATPQIWIGESHYDQPTDQSRYPDLRRLQCFSGQPSRCKVNELHFSRLRGHQVTVAHSKLLLGKNRLFNDWIMQEMAPQFR